MSPDDPRLKNLKSFKPGQSGNPLGGKLHDPELRAARQLSKKEFAEIATLVITGTINDLKLAIKDPKSSVLKVIYARIAIKIIEKGDANAFEVAFLSRLIGKVKEEHHITGNTAAVFSKEKIQKLLTDSEFAKKAAELARSMDEST